MHSVEVWVSRESEKSQRAWEILRVFCIENNSLVNSIQRNRVSFSLNSYSFSCLNEFWIPNKWYQSLSWVLGGFLESTKSLLLKFEFFKHLHLVFWPLQQIPGVKTSTTEFSAGQTDAGRSHTLRTLRELRLRVGVTLPTLPTLQTKVEDDPVSTTSAPHQRHAALVSATSTATSASSLNFQKLQVDPYIFWNYTLASDLSEITIWSFKVLKLYFST